MFTPAQIDEALFNGGYNCPSEGPNRGGWDSVIETVYSESPAKNPATIAVRVLFVNDGSFEPGVARTGYVYVSIKGGKLHADY